MDLKFFRMTTREAPAVAALVNSAYRGESSRAGWTTEADFVGGQRTSAELLCADILDPNKAILCAADAATGEILGCVYLRRSVKDGRVSCYFGMLSVKPTLQDQGMGKKILGEVERFARAEWQAARLHMVVLHVRAELIAWYERRGFRPSGESELFPEEHKSFGQPLRNDLRLLGFEKKL